MIERLKEIEAAVRNPQMSLDKIDDYLQETEKIMAECYEYTRGLKEKVESLKVSRPD